MEQLGNMMLSLISPNVSRPDRIATKESEKDNNPEYSLKMAKYIINNANNWKYQDHVKRIYRNKEFYKGRQWGMPEDTEQFLKDDGGMTRNRLRVAMNLIQPMGNMYRGTINQMDFNGIVKSYSPNVKTRRDAKLETMMLYNDIAKDNESLRSYIRSKFPVGKNDDETKQIFDNYYKDTFTQGLNDILKYSSQVNRLDRFASEFAEDELNAGMVIAKPYPSGGEWMIRRVLAERFFFDRSAIEYDLSDSWYMGEWTQSIPTDLYEQYQMFDPEDRKAIEQWLANYGRDGSTIYDMCRDGRLPVFDVYWRDCSEDWYGYVKNEFDDIIFVPLYVDDKDKSPNYKDKDLIKNSDLSDYQRKVLRLSDKDKKTNKVKNVTDYWRHCTFLPQIYSGVSAKNYYNGGSGDIVFEYGTVEYQEPERYSPCNMKPPYKVNSYIYLDGEVFSPVDIAINPQRMINRFLSVFESQVNNSGGANIIYDKDAVKENESDFLKNIKDGKPAGLRMRGMPGQNVVAPYDNNIGKGAAELIKYAELFKTITDEITGVNDASKGQASSDKLVGLMQLQIARGTIMQEPFYACIQNLYEDIYQNIISAGKRFYCDNKERLVIAVGEEEVRVLELTADLSYEDGLVTVKRSQDPEKEREKTDAMLLQYAQAGLLTDVDVANLTGRATMEQVYAALRDAAKTRIEMKRMQAEQAQQQQQQLQAQQQQAGQQAQQQQQDAKNYDMFKDQNDKSHEADMKILDHHLQQQGQNQPAQTT